MFIASRFIFAEAPADSTGITDSYSFLTGAFLKKADFLGFDDRGPTERKGERAWSRFANTPNKHNINGKQMCFYNKCRAR